MCGIIFELTDGDSNVSKDVDLMKRIKNRGPDSFNVIESILPNDLHALFIGSVLWMQGLDCTPQPVESNNGVLLYNGDIFDELQYSTSSDTRLIMEKIKNNANEQDFSSHVVSTIKSIKGPFSLIYFDKLNNDLYFARDKIGRNTLLFHKNNNNIIIGSVLGRKYKCIEVPAVYIYKTNLIAYNIILYPWKGEGKEELKLDDWFLLMQKQQELSDEQFQYEENIDADLLEENIVKFIQNVANQTQCKRRIMEKLIEDITIKDNISKITELLENSVRARLKAQPNRCKGCLTDKEVHCSHSTVGVLFSGGLDCTILAFLADKYVPKDQSIDLLNVAFKKDDNATYNVPDRLTGKKSFEELKKVCPAREWVFVEINVPKDELEALQKSTIADLVYPRKTILDESLGSALWFAAYGKSDVTTSPCRVLLLGSGADELFGGYTRHRNAFKRKGWLGLSRELELDWKRISFRNLARDNRVICDHGRQPRMPYLDEEFSQFVFNLKPWLKCFPCEDLGIGIGDKLMLRLVAFKLGLTDVAMFPKRALQFGSRIANKKEKGNNLSKSFINIK